MPLETHYRPLEGDGYQGPSSAAAYQGPASHTVYQGPSSHATYQGPSSNMFPKRPAHVIHVPDHNPGMYCETYGRYTTLGKVSVLSFVHYVR